MFSFVDVKAYRKVQNNLIKETNCFTKEDVETAEMNAMQRQETVEGLVKLREIWASTGWNVTLATCAEDIDLTVYGIEHNRCIDGDLMERVFGEDYELVYYLRTGQLPEPDLFGKYLPVNYTIMNCMKVHCQCLLTIHLDFAPLKKLPSHQNDALSSQNGS